MQGDFSAVVSKMLVVAALATSAGVLRAMEAPPAVIARLSAEDFRKRETAQEELLAWARQHPAGAMDELFRLSRVAPEPETRERCLAVLRELVNDEFSRDGEGFIGISMRDELATVPGDPKPRGAIRVVQVLRDSAAARAGLRLNDLIVGLDELVWREEAPSQPFSDKIRGMKPETRISLKILRDGDLVALEMKLGRRPLLPESPFLDQRQMDLKAAEKAAKDAYFRRWLEHRKSRK